MICKKCGEETEDVVCPICGTNQITGKKEIDNDGGYDDLAQDPAHWDDKFN